MSDETSAASATDVRQDFSLELPVIVVFFIAESSGIVSNVEVLQAIRELPSCRELDVLASNGDRISKTTDLWSTMHLGWTLLANTDTEQLSTDHLAVRNIQRRLVIG